SRAYRWNEDGLAGISDDKGNLCFAIALWNGQDAILKERLFGLTGLQGNHGEDVKEVYYYLDNTPTHSYMRMLYQYPQAAFPYQELIEENALRGRNAPEFELTDTGIFANGRYFDIFVEYAKAAPDDLLIRVNAVNRGPEAAILHVLPSLWFRNTWSWGLDDHMPIVRQGTGNLPDNPSIEAEHHTLGNYRLYCEAADDLLFTENVTNARRLFGAPNATPYVKDAFHDFLVRGNREAVNPARVGTKAAALYTRTIAAGEMLTLRLRLTRVSSDENTVTGYAPDDQLRTAHADPFADYDAVFDLRKQEADEFYAALQPADLDATPAGDISITSA
ncbi:MAG TPA: hypothetical protein VGT44_22145, partial [Ktedonobacteraceae bacterium]|nr:hypothetical protein [Ktedonobacteraceae bacterium]